MTAPHILQAVKKTVRNTGIINRGFDIDRVGTHSLQAGGEMAMILNGVSKTVVKKLGRWGGATFHTYIHTQIRPHYANTVPSMVGSGR